MQIETKSNVKRKIGSYLVTGLVKVSDREQLYSEFVESSEP